jgi:RNA-directed DNA polymerase
MPGRNPRDPHAYANPYVVPTPIPVGKTESMIEDFFTDALKATKLGGKTFKLKPTDPLTGYGKQTFADKVVKTNAEKIDFSGFAPWLKTMSDVIATHIAANPVPAKVP